MRARAKRAPEPPTPPPGEVSEGDREVLTQAFKSGLIVGWKRDNERGYRLTLGDRQDAFVELTKLTGYLDVLRKGKS